VSYVGCTSWRCAPYRFTLGRGAPSKDNVVETFSIVPSFKKFRVTVPDPNFDYNNEEWLNSEDDVSTVTKALILYCKGAGCPVPVEFEVDKLQTEYIREYPDRSNIGQGLQYADLNEYADEVRRVNTLLWRNMLLAIAKPGSLDVNEANILANESNAGRELLVRTGWLGEPVPFTVNTNEDAENKTEGNDETGESTLEILSPPTQE
jgi:hypothetical protein